MRWSSCQTTKGLAVLFHERDRYQVTTRNDVIGKKCILTIGSGPRTTNQAQQPDIGPWRTHQMRRRGPDDAVAGITIIADAQGLQ